MLYLRQATASQSVLIGPFVDDTDAVTAETGLTIDAADIRLSKNGANIVGKNSGGGTHDELGYYTITLDATDTDTVGRLQLMVAETGALPVYHEFQVLEEAIYDGMFAASAGALATAAALATVDGNVDSILEDTGTTLPATLSTIDGNVDAILLDTAEIGAAGAGLTAINLPNQTMDITGNITGNLSGSVGSVTGNVGGTVAELGTQAKADVNAEVLDVLNTDTFAEPTGVPAATATLAAKIGYLYMALRNKVTVTASKKTFFDDGDAAEWEKDLSDDGTTYTESEGNAI